MSKEDGRNSTDPKTICIQPKVENAPESTKAKPLPVFETYSKPHWDVQTSEYYKANDYANNASGKANLTCCLGIVHLLKVFAADVEKHVE